MNLNSDGNKSVAILIKFIIELITLYDINYTCNNLWSPSLTCVGPLDVLDTSRSSIILIV